MNICFSTFLLLLTTLKQSTALYSPLHTYTEPWDRINMISLSEHNEVFISGGDDNKIQIYLNEGDSFAHYGTLGEENSNIHIADITADGKWILCAHEQGTVVLYKHNFTTNSY